MIDRTHRRIEDNGKIRAVGGDQRAIPFDDAPVHAGVDVAPDISRRYTVERRAAVIS